MASRTILLAAVTLFGVCQGFLTQYDQQGHQAEPSNVGANQQYGNLSPANEQFRQGRRVNSQQPIDYKASAAEQHPNQADDYEVGYRPKRLHAQQANIGQYGNDEATYQVSGNYQKGSNYPAVGGYKKRYSNPEAENYQQESNYPVAGKYQKGSSSEEDNDNSEETYRSARKMMTLKYQQARYEQPQQQQQHQYSDNY